MEALRAVAASRSVIDPQVVDALFRGRARLRASALNNLTPRELEVLREMAQGRAATPASPRSCTCPSHRWKTRQRHLHQARLTSKPTSHHRVTAVLTFLRDARLRGRNPRSQPQPDLRRVTTGSAAYPVLACPPEI